MKFEFSTSGRIVFGTGALEQLGKAPELDGVKRVVLIRGTGKTDAGAILEILEARGLAWVEFVVSGEPTIDQIRAGVMLARDGGVERIIGFGGGSVIDTAKAIAALAVNPGDVLDYLEVVGGGKPLQKEALGVVAVPTTAGTGSEVTRNAVISVPEYSVKVSLRSQSMLPWLALVDPKLTLTMPPDVTASTGMDAMAQVLEPFVSARANPLADGFCRTGLARVGRALRAAYLDGNDIQAREEMSLVSLMGGLALANAGLGAVHGFAGPLGGRYNLPHGVLCARLLPAVVQVNTRALEMRDPNGPALDRYQEATRLLLGNDRAVVEDLTLWLEEYCRALGIPKFRKIGIPKAQFNEIADQAAAASSMKANPILLVKEEQLEILELAY